MTTTHKSSALAAALLLGVALAGCGRAPQPEAVPPPPPAPANMEPAPAAPAAPANSQAPPPDTAPAAPAQPAPAAPPPQDSSPVPTPTSSEPALDAMKLAQASAKMSVAVDLRYQIEAATPGGPMTLHLAAIPQVEGTRFEVNVKPEDGIQLTAGALTVQKSGSGSVYRRQYALTRGTSAPAALRVLVTMDTAAGSGFGYFTVPLDGGTSAQNKQDSVKQR